MLVLNYYFLMIFIIESCFLLKVCDVFFFSFISVINATQKSIRSHLFFCMRLLHYLEIWELFNSDTFSLFLMTSPNSVLNSSSIRKRQSLHSVSSKPLAHLLLYNCLWLNRGGPCWRIWEKSEWRLLFMPF